MEKSDPYIDSNTGVLKNLLNIKDENIHIITNCEKKE